MAALETGRLPLKVALIINPTDSDGDGKRCLEVVGEQVNISRPGSAAAPKSYGPFCGVFESARTFFDTPPVNVADEVESALRDGVGFGLFSFGGQGQGKTTALWGSPALGPEEAIVPRFCADLFPIIDRCKAATDTVVVAASFLRVSALGEIVNDCLVKDIKASGLGLRLREAAGNASLAEGEFFMEGQKRQVVSDPSQLASVALDGLEQAELIDRSDAEFQRGERSHKLLTVQVLRRTESGDLYNTKLHFLDTAGVERPSATTKTASKAFGGKTPQQRKAEMMKGKQAPKEDATNKAIIRVLDSCVDNLKHIPYRDSKLTRLLKSSLGGAGRGVVVGCVAGAASSHAETDAMLQFLHKCSTGVSTTPTPFVLNAAAELAKREPAVVALAAQFLGVANAEDALKLQPHEVECTMQSPPEVAELRDLIAQCEALKKDPLDELLAEQ